MNKISNEIIYRLFEASDVIIKFKINKELLGKKEILPDQYIDSKVLKYWLNVFEGKKIHGREDSTFENSIAKLLEFGLDKSNNEFHEKYSNLLNDSCWTRHESFEDVIIKVVIYPFLIRAGYRNEKLLDFFFDRLETIERTIKKYGYEFEEKKKPKRFENEFVFSFDSRYESLPTIYDLYAYAFFSDTDQRTRSRIENIIQYILNDKFQRIPKKAYLYDANKKRYYAVGNVYHACLIKERKLYYLYLLSHFNYSRENKLFNTEINKLSQNVCEDGFYEFDLELLKEKKDSYYLYSGNHMGLGENRKNKTWRKIESTFWMLKILFNLEQ